MIRAAKAMNLADAAGLKKKGNELFGRGKYAEAVEAYTQAIDLWMEPKDRAVLYSNRSAARLKIAGEKQKALSDAERAVQLAPDYAKAHFRRGQALRALGEAAKAAEAMQEVLRLEPSDQAATLALAELRGALEAAAAKAAKARLANATPKADGGASPEDLALAAKAYEKAKAHAAAYATRGAPTHAMGEAPTQWSFRQSAHIDPRARVCLRAAGPRRRPKRR